MLVFDNDENNFDLLEKTLVLLVVEELLLLEALLQEIHLTIEVVKVMAEDIFLTIRVMMMKMMVEVFLSPPLGCLSRSIRRFSPGQTSLGLSCI